MVATTMHLQAALLMLLCCFMFLATLNAQQQPQATASASTASPPSCIPHERDALLAFKHGVTSYPAGVLKSWRRDGSHEEQDCCRWRGVRCSNRTGHVHELRLGGTQADLVGQISPCLLALDHLEHLDLSWNDLAGPTGRIPKFLGSLKNLKYLNLSGIAFNGGVPPQLGNLSRLQYLDLSNIMGGTYTTDLSWLTHLSSIQFLNLNSVNLNTVMDWPHVMNMLPSLRVLRLSTCSLASANQSLAYLNLTNLEELDASGNFFDHPMMTSWFWNITSLRYIYLDNTGMYGQFPDALGGMESLQVLDLSANVNYDGSEKSRIMTTNLKNLCNLEVLNLYSALIYGSIAELFQNNLPRCSPNKLQELDLGSNQLTGMLPRWIGKLTSLVVLNLDSNNITGSIPPSIGQFTNLQTLDLSCNNLNGHVPYEIGKLSKLTYLDLNKNKLNGTITEEHIASARSLQYIDLSSNALRVEISSDWQPPSKLDVVIFASCQMGPRFPGWLQWNVSFTYLDISSAGIADRLPQWFSDAFSNVKFLNIANNQLNGTLPTDMGFMSLLELFLSSNQLTGQITTLPPTLKVLDLSNNFLSGPLSSFTTSANPTQISLFSNQIIGHIPESFCKFQGLFLLDLSNNFLVGEIPSCLGVMEELEFIALSNNSLSGEFPTSVQNFTNLVALDLSRNKFSGGLPMWIGQMTSLAILRLSHNNFYGNIPVNITNLGCLQYIDLHNNKISGSLPSNFSNLETMRKTNMIDVQCGTEVIEPVYPFSLEDDVHPFHLSGLSMVLKGQELNYGSMSRVVGTRMTSIDLSSNNLIGKIPEDIIVLDGLVNLNLSWNHFSGVIPNKMGKMQSLESLDLSRNMLSGEIPTTLSNLTFLSDLDLSYNNLTGRIPSGQQLDTLYAEYPSMYTGNTGLCGHPLPNSCSNEGEDVPKDGGPGRTEEGHGIQFFYLGLGCGFVVGTWIAFGVLLFKRSWRIACFRISDKLCDKVYVLVAVWAIKTGNDHHA